MFKKISISFLVWILAVHLFTVQASAHVVVKPAEVGLAERTNFIVSVPTEEDNPTVSVRLLIPESLQSVRPNVKPGWNIELIKDGEGDASRITEIIWSGGSIPPDQRDEFVFSAQAPAMEEDVIWKAYQTYASGTIVSWDKDPEVVKQFEKKKIQDTQAVEVPEPYSVTKVVNDMAEPTGEEPQEENTETMALLRNGVLAALLMSGISLWLHFNRKK